MQDWNQNYDAFAKKGLDLLVSDRTKYYKKLLVAVQGLRTIILNELFHGQGRSDMPMAEDKNFKEQGKKHAAKT